MIIVPAVLSVAVINLTEMRLGFGYFCLVMNKKGNLSKCWTILWNEQNLRLYFSFKAKVFPGQLNLPGLEYNIKMADKTSQEFKKASLDINEEVSKKLYYFWLFLWSFFFKVPGNAHPLLLCYLFSSYSFPEAIDIFNNNILKLYIALKIIQRHFIR